MWSAVCFEPLFYVSNGLVYSFLRLFMFFYFAEVSAVTAVNIALEDADWNQTYEMLKCNDLALAALVSECGQSYHEQLKEIRAERLQEGRLFISTLL